MVYLNNSVRARFPKYKATMSIATSLGWVDSSLQVTLKISCNLFVLVEKETLRVMFQD